MSLRQWAQDLPLEQVTGSFFAGRVQDYLRVRSTYRAQQLFRDEMGMTIGQYRRWRLSQHVVELIRGGATAREVGQRIGRSKYAVESILRRAGTNIGQLREQLKETT